MKDFLCTILGIVSYSGLFFALKHFAVLLDTRLSMASILAFFVYIIANYIAFLLPVSATTSMQYRKTPLLILYVYISIAMSIYIIAEFINAGFSLFYLIVDGFVILMAILSFIKCIGNNNSPADDIKQLELLARTEDISFAEFMNAKESVIKESKQTSIIGIIIYVVTIGFSTVVLLNIL